MIAPTITLDQRQLAAYLKRLDKNRGKPLHQRAERTIDAAAKRVLVPALKREAARGKGKRLAGGFTRGGNLRRRSKSKLLRKRGSEVIRPTWVGSSAYYTHMVIGGTKDHSLAPRAAGRIVSFTQRNGRTRTFKATLKKSPIGTLPDIFNDGGVRSLAGIHHPGSRPDPFVQRAVDPNLDIVYSLIRRDVFDVR